MREAREKIIGGPARRGRRQKRSPVRDPSELGPAAVVPDKRSEDGGKPTKVPAPESLTVTAGSSSIATSGRVRPRCSCCAVLRRARQKAREREREQEGWGKTQGGPFWTALALSPTPPPRGCETYPHVETLLKTRALVSRFPGSRVPPKIVFGHSPCRSAHLAPPSRSPGGLSPHSAFVSRESLLSPPAASAGSV